MSPRQTAWRAVYDGYVKALTTPCLDDEDRGFLLRQSRRAASLAGVPAKAHRARVVPSSENVVRLDDRRPVSA